MHIPQSYTEKLKEKKVVAYNHHQFVTAQLYEYFNKKEKYTELMGLVKRYGARCVWELFNELIKENGSCPIQLLKWKLKQIKIKMKEVV